MKQSLHQQLPALTISTPVIALEADGDFGPDDEENCPATTRLSNKQPVEINSASFHLELIEVDEDGNAVNTALQANIDAVWTLCGARPASMEINSKRYVAVIFPHED